MNAVATRRHEAGRLRAAYLVFCVCLFALLTSGRIAIPDDEIVFQTTQSMWERGSLEIEGTKRRAGEVKGQTTGTFGWAEGVDGRRYGFFGHGLSVVALPLYGLGKVAAAQAPPKWRFSIRSAHFWLRPRSQFDDWTRLIVGLTNGWVTAVAGLFLMAWVRTLRFQWSTAALLGFTYAFATLSLPYTRTFLSEPLSTALLLAGAWAVARYHVARQESRPRVRRWLWLASACVGASVHVHVLNIVAVPCFIGYAVLPLWRDEELPSRRKELAISLAIGSAWLGALGLSQWARFGSPFETGRYDIYSTFIVPGESLLALLFSPGRSLWLTSPILLVALLGARGMVRRTPAAAWFAIAIVATRLLFVASRSDWWGGWALGPRFLLPVIPFALLPLATAWQRASRRWTRLLIAVAVAANVALMMYLSCFSVFDWMIGVFNETPKSASYIARANWELGTHHIAYFSRLEPDLLFEGAVRFAQSGTAGLAQIGYALAGLACLAALRFAIAWRRLARSSGNAYPPGHVRQGTQA